jgi:SAM-dependent methyltransferase
MPHHPEEHLIDLFQSAEQMTAATNYNDWTFSQFRPYVKGAVLEVGCGVGSFTERLLAYGGFTRLVSIDTSADAIRHCSSRFSDPALHLACVDLQNLQGVFDTIICMNVLEHIADDRHALRHLWNLLGPHGTLFLLVPAHHALFSRFDAEGGHYRRYDKRTMSNLVKAVTDAPHHLDQYYFNCVGALGYCLIYKVLRRAPRAGAASEIGFFDRCIVPVVRRLEGRHLPFGISLIAILTKD